MPDRASNKRKQDEKNIVSAAKRRRSASRSSTSSSVSEFDDEQEFALDTPATPLTPATPSKPPYRPYRPNIYGCPYDGCGKAFNRPVRLEEHIRSHTNSRPFKCTHDGCDKDFLRQSHLAHHMKSAHTEDRDYICDWVGCDKKFATGTRLRRHQQAHAGREQFRCTGHPPCNQTFRKHATLQRHIDADHLGRKAFSCSQCDSGFDSAVRLKAHETRLHGEKRHWCSLCVGTPDVETEAGSEPQGVGFVTYSELQDHIRQQHPPTCDACSLVFSSTRELQRHVDIHHSGITLEDRKTFICPVVECSKGFTKQGNLNIHVRTVHQNVKAFVCGVTDLSLTVDLEAWDRQNACGHAFTAKASLENHVRREHLGGKSSQVKNKNTTKKKTVQPSPTSSTFARLTGVGYADESGRDIVCIVRSCPFRFKREFDLETHAKTAHGMLDEDIEEALANREALVGGKFWDGSVEGFDDMLEKQEAYSMNVDVLPSSFSELDDGKNRPQPPRLPFRHSRLVRSNHQTRDSTPTDIDAIDFEALVNFCTPMEQTGEAEQVVDPSLMSEPVVGME